MDDVDQLFQMADNSSNVPMLNNNHLMSPFVLPESNSSSHLSLYSHSSPSFHQPFYMNWGMQPYSQYSPAFDHFQSHPQACFMNQMVPSDPFPSSNLISSVSNENIPPQGAFECESSIRNTSLSKTSRTKKSDHKKRTMFTTDQTHSLNVLFVSMNNLMKKEREELGEAIGLDQQQIKIWLQNRRYKEKKKNVEVADHLKSKYDYDEQKAKEAVRGAIEEFERRSGRGTNNQYFPY